MLTENDVVQAVVGYLRENDYFIERALSTAERGIDIVAVNQRTKRKLYVEAKGGTSSKKTTNRYGKPFTPGQAKVHVSVALCCAAHLYQHSVADGADVALAFPDGIVHRDLVQNISRALQVLAVGVYFVDEDKKVQVFKEAA